MKKTKSDINQNKVPEIQAESKVEIFSKRDHHFLNYHLENPSNVTKKELDSILLSLSPRLPNLVYLALKEFSGKELVKRVSVTFTFSIKETSPSGETSKRENISSALKISPNSRFSWLVKEEIHANN